MIDVIICLIMCPAMLIVGSVILLKEIIEIFKKWGDTMEWVNFKVKEGEREKLKNDAHAHRMNISEYLRFLIEKERQDMRKEDGKNG